MVRGTVFPTNAHQPPDALFVHGMALVLQVPGHLPDAVKRGVQKLFVDQQHQVEVHLGLARRFMVKRRPRDRQQAALRPDRQLGMGPFDHALRHCLSDQWRSNASSLPGPRLELS